MADSKETRESQIKKLVEEMKLYNNPELLEEMKKTLRKNVPFSMRGYLLAYLYITSKHYSAKQVERKSESRTEIAGAKSLYINVGKLSRGSSRDLVQFICEESHLSEEDILSVSYKQNYSFINLKEEKAKSVIESINGKTYRGRKVKVDFSKESSANA